MKVEFKIIDPRLKDEGMMPTYATPGSAAVDLRACINEPIVLQPGQTKMIPVGFAIYIKDPGFAAMMLPRSGLGSKGLVLGNLTGLIDSDYQGQMQVVAWNRNPVLDRFGGKTNAFFDVNPMDRIAQLVIVPVVRAEWQLVEEFEASERGAGGFGSTGK